MKNNINIYVAQAKQWQSDLVGWSMLLLAATVWSFVHLLLGLSNRNKMVLWPGCEGYARRNLHKKNLQFMWFVVNTRAYCFNLSVDVALNVQFITNRMCAKNNTHIYVSQTSKCCLLPRCEALHTFCYGFPIATPWIQVIESLNA